MLFQDHFIDLFTSSSPSSATSCIATLGTKVSEEQNEILTRPYSSQEVEDALFNMNGLSSPRPDGFPALFYQKHWPVVGQQVCDAVLNVLNSNGSMGSINSTFIALIPKKKNPLKVIEFRPISLCNVIYKIISKAIANRLKKVLHGIISPSQSAFVPNRLITDNVIVAFEAFHTMNCKMTGKEGYMALKLDMSKAYDRVEWSFLRVVLYNLGFSSQWVELVMKCIETVSYALMVNGVPQPEFYPTRGLRQGDPLSPYLFILCAEALSNLIHKAEGNKLIHGVTVARGKIRISHLFFADDSLLFCKANAVEWGNLVNLLRSYEMASGQRLNLKKTSIMFSQNTARSTQDYILSIAGRRSAMPYEKYLGLPSIWGDKWLDQSNRRKVTSPVKNLDENAKVDVLIDPETKRWKQDLIQDTFEVREAQLIMETPISAMATGDRIIWHGTKNGSFSVRSAYHMENDREVAAQGQASTSNSLKEVWNRIWQIQATPGDKTFLWRACQEALPTQYNLYKKRVVSDPICPICNREEEMRSAYHMENDREVAAQGQASTSNSLKEVWNRIWQIQATPGDKTFLWRACQEALPTQYNLYKKRVVSDPICPICNREEESVQHVLWSCEAAKGVWSQCSKRIQKCSFPISSMIQLFSSLTKVLSPEELQEFVMIARKIWWRRNSFIFKKEFVHPNHIVREARAVLEMLSEKNLDQCTNQISPPTVSWQAPPTNWFKINWDGAVDKGKGLIGIGVVIRNSLG
ncbi:uncharacterized protein LOC118344031 [Juglans regia]|uniref:Uncharacterized protein LOC118344031 n=1 Tax=Juglans regia TaxID=51240 RepID=A0A6P9DWY7_JUGRE|nr:uncharacterized protein LOC118344031 [Juglans regia]